MHRLVQWSAKRSGPCMVIKGIDREDGAEVKLTSVYEIKRDDQGRIFAENGVGHRVAYLN